MAVRQEWDIRRVLLVLSRWWWWPVLTISVSIASAWLYLRYTVAIYRSEATVQIDPNRSYTPQLGQKSGAGDYGLAIDFVSEKYLELFSDYQVISEVISQGKFNFDVYSLGKVGSYLIYPAPIEIDTSPERDSLPNKRIVLLIEVSDDSTYKLIREDQVVKVAKWESWIEWDGRRIRLRRTRPLASGKYLLRYQPVEEAVSYWIDRVRVMPKRGFTVLSVMVADISAPRAQAFCNVLLQGARLHERDIQREYYDRIISYIDTLIDIVLTDIEKVQDTIKKTEASYEIPLADVRSKALFDKYQGYTDNSLLMRYQDLNWLEKQLEVLYSYVNRKADSLPLLIIPPSLSESMIEAQSLNEKIRSYNKISAQYANSSVLVQKLLEDIGTELQSALKVIEAEKKLMASKQEQLGKYISSGLSRFYKDTDYKRRLDLINFDWESKRKIYEILIERRLQMNIERSGITSLMRVTQPPILPSSPISPNKIQVYVIFILLGIIVGIGGIFLREILTQQISYRRDIEPISPVPVIGELPATRKRDRGYGLGVGYLSNLQIEILRSLRSSMDFLWDKQGPKVIIVTSTVSGEGKTYISSALAYIYALTGRKVLLVDADMRRAALTQQQGLMQAPGLSTLLAPSLEGRENGLRNHPLWVNFLLENLYLLPSGPLPPNATELLTLPRLRELILSWQTEFDYFIFDTAPIGLVPDALPIFSQFPEAISLYIFRADYSRYTFLNHLEDIVKQNHLKKVYLLFNGTKLNRPRYGYGYGYGYYGDSYGAYRYYHSGKKHSWPERVRKWIPL